MGREGGEGVDDPPGPSPWSATEFLLFYDGPASNECTKNTFIAHIEKMEFSAIWVSLKGTFILDGEISDL